MSRRKLMGLVGAAAASPVAGRAQQPALRVIGFLHTRLVPLTNSHVSAFSPSRSVPILSLTLTATISSLWQPGIDCP